MPYRDDREHLEGRRAELRAELEGAEVRVRSLEVARVHAAALERELVALDRRIAEHAPPCELKLIEGARVVAARRKLMRGAALALLGGGGMLALAAFSSNPEPQPIAPAATGYLRAGEIAVGRTRNVPP